MVGTAVGPFLAAGHPCECDISRVRVPSPPPQLSAASSFRPNGGRVLTTPAPATACAPIATSNSSCGRFLATSFPRSSEPAAVVWHLSRNSTVALFALPLPPGTSASLSSAACLMAHGACANGSLQLAVRIVVHGHNRPTPLQQPAPMLPDFLTAFSEDGPSSSAGIAIHNLVIGALWSAVAGTSGPDWAVVARRLLAVAASGDMSRREMRNAFTLCSQLFLRLDMLVMQPSTGSQVRLPRRHASKPGCSHDQHACAAVAAFASADCRGVSIVPQGTKFRTNNDDVAWLSQQKAKILSVLPWKPVSADSSYLVRSAVALRRDAACWPVSVSCAQCFVRAGTLHQGRAGSQEQSAYCAEPPWRESRLLCLSVAAWTCNSAPSRPSWRRLSRLSAASSRRTRLPARSRRPSPTPATCPGLPWSPSMWSTSSARR